MRSLWEIPSARARARAQYLEPCDTCPTVDGNAAHNNDQHNDKHDRLAGAGPSNNEIVHLASKADE